MAGKRSGAADLPLHGGKAPRWLFEKMVLLSRAILEYMALEFGVEEILSRLSDPFWFQALGCVLGFDWHSSGLTTTTTGALKEALKGLDREIGLFIAGGKGRTSRKTPDEVLQTGKWLDIDPEILVRASKLTAKVDSAVVQDGFNLYHHTIFYSRDGKWAVIQQGMNDALKQARRYHWQSENLKSFVDQPHTGIASDVKLPTLDLTNKPNEFVRTGVVELLKNTTPLEIEKELLKIRYLELPARHPVTFEDVNPKRLQKVFLKLYENPPQDFTELISTKGAGAKTLRALALTTELIYGRPLDFTDPARFSFAHGGKDGYPYPVDLKVYSATIAAFEKAIKKSKLGENDKVKALRRLYREYNIQ